MVRNFEHSFAVVLGIKHSNYGRQVSCYVGPFSRQGLSNCCLLHRPSCFMGRSQLPEDLRNLVNKMASYPLAYGITCQHVFSMNYPEGLNSSNVFLKFMKIAFCWKKIMNEFSCLLRVRWEKSNLLIRCDRYVVNY